MAKKRELIDQPYMKSFVEQVFPVNKSSAGFKTVKVVEYFDDHKEYDCFCFTVNVWKDNDGYVYFSVRGKTYDHDNAYIMNTTDFNEAYDLKIKLDELLDKPVTEKEKMHCYGSLRREVDTSKKVAGI